jgi:hypothetical protein
MRRLSSPWPRKLRPPFLFNGVFSGRTIFAWHGVRRPNAGSHWSNRAEVGSLLREGRNAEALEKARTITDDPRVQLVEACLEKCPSSEIAEISRGAHGFALSDPEIRYTTAENEAFCGRNQVALGLLVVGAPEASQS